jgi:hypothetical protein
MKAAPNEEASRNEEGSRKRGGTEIKAQNWNIWNIRAGLKQRSTVK